jgi:hypothetical protein
MISNHQLVGENRLTQISISGAQASLIAWFACANDASLRNWPEVENAWRWDKLSTNLRNDRTTVLCRAGGKTWKGIVKSIDQTPMLSGKLFCPKNKCHEKQLRFRPTQ